MTTGMMAMNERRPPTERLTHRSPRRRGGGAAQSHSLPLCSLHCVNRVSARFKRSSTATSPRTASPCGCTPSCRSASALLRLDSQDSPGSGLSAATGWISERCRRCEPETTCPGSCPCTARRPKRLQMGEGPGSARWSESVGSLTVRVEHFASELDSRGAERICVGESEPKSVDAALPRRLIRSSDRSIPHEHVVFVRRRRAASLCPRFHCELSERASNRASNRAMERNEHRDDHRNDQRRLTSGGSSRIDRKSLRRRRFAAAIDEAEEDDDEVEEGAEADDSEAALILLVVHINLLRS
jgi:hypothetical protein